MRDEAKARNEALFRNVNERLEAISQSLAATDPTMEFLCECDDIECHATVSATRAEYESVRAEPTHFIVLPDHFDPRVEEVVLSNERFLVVEKEGVAARRAEASDPRET
jgi:hypothetical protein